MDLDLAQLRALSAAVSEGTFEAAARVLHVTPSAVSQRLRALEVATGRVLLVRSKPVRVTESGEALLRLARQIELLAADAAAELGADPDGGPNAPTLPIAVNADSLGAWVLPALAGLDGSVSFDLRVDDEDHTAALVRSGAVMAAVTAEPEPVPGCSVTRLGSMRYRPMAAPAFADRWFPGGPTRESLGRAPVVVFDRKDQLQHRYLREHAVGPVHPPTHYVPSSADFLAAVRLGLGWGMVPEAQGRGGERAGALVSLDPRGAIDVVLHWQQWKLRSVPLDRVADALLVAARRELRQ